MRLQVIQDSAEVDAAVHITLTHSQQAPALEKSKGALLQPTALEVQVGIPALLRSCRGSLMRSG